MLIKNYQILIFFIICALFNSAYANKQLAEENSQLIIQSKVFQEQLFNPNKTNFNQLKKLPYLDSLQLKKVHFESQNVETTRAKLIESFEHNIYGYSPKVPNSEMSLVEKKVQKFPNEDLYVETLDFDLKPLIPNVRYSELPNLRLTLFIPYGLKPRAVFLALNKCGNHLITQRLSLSIRNLSFQHKDCFKSDYKNTNTDAFWNLNEIIRNGFAFATLHESDLAPDKKDLANSKVKKYYEFSPYNGKHGWGNIATWAWGLRLTAQALKKSGWVADSPLISIGHSRRGKAALLAAAFDTNIDMTIPHQSGTWGLALARNHYLKNPETYFTQYGSLKNLEVSSLQETIAINDFLFDHWFNKYSETFKENEDRLPVDQHLLLALMAPRPVLSTEGTKDHWANFNSSLQTLNLGLRYYEYYGVDSKKIQLINTHSDYKCPEMGSLAQARLPTKHTMTIEYWKIILKHTECLLKI